MKQITIAALAGAAVYFVWQMLTWMVIPIHGLSVAALPDEDMIRDALVEQNIDNWMHFDGFYTAMFVVDAIVGWFLVGLVVAAIIKPRREAALVE